jgi:hypothetical protein
MTLKKAKKGFLREFSVLVTAQVFFLNTENKTLNTEFLFSRVHHL